VLGLVVWSLWFNFKNMDQPNKSPERSTWLQLGLWLVIGLLGVLCLWSIYYEYRTHHVIHSVSVAIGIGLVLCCVVGVLFGWGPTLPCLFLGILVASLMAGRPTHRYEIVFKKFGVPLIGAIFGSIVGLVLDQCGAVSSVPTLPRRFSLRTLLIATTAIAVVLGLIVYATR
jgi:hypothetical protein